MPELLALLALPVLAGGTTALRAVLDGRAARVPASIAVLAPASEGARALRTLPLLARGGAAVRIGAQTYEPLPPFLVALAIYIPIVYALVSVQRWVERRTVLREAAA